MLWDDAFLSDVPGEGRGNQTTKKGNKGSGALVDGEAAVGIQLERPPSKSEY
jgi:hypothetical protein